MEANKVLFGRKFISYEQLIALQFKFLAVFLTVVKHKIVLSFNDCEPFVPWDQQVCKENYLIFLPKWPIFNNFIVKLSSLSLQFDFTIFRLKCFVETNYFSIINLVLGKIFKLDYREKYSFFLFIPSKSYQLTLVILVNILTCNNFETICRMAHFPRE